MLKKFTSLVRDLLKMHSWYETEAFVYIRDDEGHAKGRVYTGVEPPGRIMIANSVVDVVICERCSKCGNRRQYSRTEDQYYYATLSDKPCYVPPSTSLRDFARR